MNNLEFKKGVEELRQLSLTEGEKSFMLKKIIERPHLSPFHIFYPYSLGAVALVLLLTGTLTSLAAEKSLPGEPLYTIKIGVNEPFRSIITMGADAQVDWQAQKVERRLKEAKLLVNKDQLDDKQVEYIEEKLDENIVSLDNAIKKSEDKREGEINDKTDNLIKRGKSEELKKKVEKQKNELRKAREDARREKEQGRRSEEN